jgi:hypothetical protein
MNKLSTVFPIMIEKYEQFIPNIEGMGVPDKINAIIQYLNRIGKLSNDVVADWNKVMVWVMGEGLTDAVNTKVDDMVAKGTFDDLLTGMFDVINADVTDFKNTINGQVNTLTSSLAEIATIPNGKFDGITDDTTAVQNAINSLTSGYVLLPNKNIVLTTINMKSNVWIISNQATILVPVNAPASQHVFKFTSVQNTGILGNLKIEGKRTQQTSVGDNGQHGIFIYMGQDLYFDHLYLHQLSGDGLYVGQGTTPSSGIHVNRIIADDCGRNGISLTNVNGIHFNFASVRNNVTALPMAGVDVEPNVTTDKCSNIVFDYVEAYGNLIGLSVVSGVNPDQVQPNGVYFNYFYTHHNTNHGILLQHCRNVHGKGISEYNTQHGMLIRPDVNKIRFEGIFRYNQQAGVMGNLTGQTISSYNWNFDGSVFANNSIGTPNTYDGLRVDSDSATYMLDRISAQNCEFFDDQTTHTQRYGFYSASYTSRIKATGRFIGNVTGNYSASSTSPLNFFETGLASYIASVSGTVSANSNLDVDITLPTGMLSGGDRLTHTINSSLPAGVIPFVFRAGNDIARVRLQNVTASPITVNSTNFNFIVSKI